MRRGRPRPCGAVAVRHGFQPYFEASDRACDGARALLIKTPSTTPWGADYRPGTVAAVAEIARRRNLRLISDVLYDGMVRSGMHRSPRACRALRSGRS